MGSSMCDPKSLYWIAGRAPGTEGGERYLKKTGEKRIKKRGKNGRLAYQSIIHTPHTQRDTHTDTHTGVQGTLRGIGGGAHIDRMGGIIIRNTHTQWYRFTRETVNKGGRERGKCHNRHQKSLQNYKKDRKRNSRSCSIRSKGSASAN